MTDYIKRIQSALSRDVKVSRTEIRQFMTQENIPLNNPSEEEIERVKFYFLSELEANNKDALTVNSKQTVQEEARLTANPEPFITREIEGIEDYDNSEGSPSTDLSLNPDMKELVSFKAQEMGIKLAETQIEIIASEIDLKKHSFLQTISDIEAALIAYIDYQHSQESNQVDAMLERVTERVALKNHAINQQLSGGIADFTNTMEELDQKQKKITSNILMRLKVPVG